MDILKDRKLADYLILDLGNPLTWDRSQFLKHLFKRIFAIPNDRVAEFYQRHLAYY